MKILKQVRAPFTKAPGTKSGRAISSRKHTLWVFCGSKKKRLIDPSGKKDPENK